MTEDISQTLSPEEEAGHLHEALSRLVEVVELQAERIAELEVEVDRLEEALSQLEVSS